uniref:DUF659 domain-containing protein n=1 Tax=Lactuca sativa TaxID=4236 RepID=A0A9R1VWU2_LACSA|nr:hypothetical protein LSAT_V11C400177650 [Lactuca sativa]
MGISFLKSVDASDIERNATNLCNLFAEIVEMLVGTKLYERYPFITWSTCAAYCLNLVLKDLSELDNVNSLVNLASRLRRRPGWKEIIRLGATRFGTAFIALQSLYDHKANLQVMVISNKFKKMLKVGNVVECKQIVLDEIFWKNCLITVKVMTHLLKLLQLCDSDEKPAIGYVYVGMRRERRGVKELFKKKKELYNPYTNIIDSRRDRMLRKVFIVRLIGVLEMVENTFKGDDVLNITLNLGRFRDADGTFDRSSVVASRNLTHEWWKLFGGDIMNIKSTRIFFRLRMIHTKRRNRLEHQRLNDLVFVRYNLRLQNRLKVVEEEREGELNYDDLENMFDEQEHEPTSQIQDDHVDHEVDSEFQLLSDCEIDAYNTPISQDP